ncbi:histidine phosphatase family protein [Streptantibioticus parmotrematis]|uniref:histidine phosphatase family protein n=1 Tax=Streptantibioticus parmotrematis TaxID=2873249 RepID=UPI0033C14B7D
MRHTTHTTVHLVRHGQSTWNAAGLVQGQSPRAGALTPRGRREGERAARALAALRPGATRVIASDLPRARETAEIIASRLDLPIGYDPGLREQHLGVWEGRRHDERAVRDAVQELWSHPHITPEGGESIAALHTRVWRALRLHAAAYPGDTLIAVTHGGPVRMAVTTADPRQGRSVPRDPVGNASVTTITVGVPSSAPRR